MGINRTSVGPRSGRDAEANAANATNAVIGTGAVR